MHGRGILYEVAETCRGIRLPFSSMSRLWQEWSPLIYWEYWEGGSSLTMQVTWVEYYLLGEMNKFDLVICHFRYLFACMPGHMNGTHFAHAWSHEWYKVHVYAWSHEQCTCAYAWSHERYTLHVCLVTWLVHTARHILSIVWCIGDPEHLITGQYLYNDFSRSIYPVQKTMLLVTCSELVSLIIIDGCLSWNLDNEVCIVLCRLCGASEWWTIWIHCNRTTDLTLLESQVNWQPQSYVGESAEIGIKFNWLAILDIMVCCSFTCVYITFLQTVSILVA